MSELEKIALNELLKAMKKFGKGVILIEVHHYLVVCFSNYQLHKV